MIYRISLRFLAHVLLAAMLLLPTLGACEEASTWNKFIVTPTYDSYLRFAPFWKKPCEANRPGQRDLRKVLSLVSKGNSAAFQSLLETRACLDGGALEDFYRAAGSYFEKQPHAFVALVSQYGVKHSELSYMLGMLPLTSVDQPRLRLRLIEGRLATLALVQNKSLLEVIDACKDVLSGEAETYRRMLDEADKQSKH